MRFTSYYCRAPTVGSGCISCCSYSITSRALRVHRRVERSYQLATTRMSAGPDHTHTHTQPNLPYGSVTWCRFTSLGRFLSTAKTMLEKLSRPDQQLNGFGRETSRGLGPSETAGISCRFRTAVGPRPARSSTRIRTSRRGDRHCRRVWVQRYELVRGLQIGTGGNEDPHVIQWYSEHSDLVLWVVKLASHPNSLKMVVGLEW